MSIFLMIVGAILIQVVISGAMGPSILNNLTSKCETKHGEWDSSYREMTYRSCEDFHASEAYFVAFFWPVTIPFLVSSFFGKKYAIGSKPVRIEAKRAREMEEAKHRTALSAERAKQLEVLEREAGLTK